MMIRRQIGILGAALLFGVSRAHASPAQDQGARPAISENEAAKSKSSSQTDDTPGVNVVAKTSEGTRLRLVGRFLDDQRRIWTSPAQLRLSDTEWLFPLSGITAGLFVTDGDSNKHLSQNPTTISRYNTLSNVGVGALVGSAGGMWLLGRAEHNEHWSETGFLAGEASLNSVVVAEGLKYSLGRERPFQGDGSGPFFQGGGTSFPSEHAAAAWSVAGVIAHEYPGPLTKILAYGAAGLISYSRVRAQQHFPSDALVGALIGELSAYTVYQRHHDPELGGEEWESWSSHARRMFEEPTRANMGSPYVPLDSWVYPAIERLMGLGLIDSGFLAHRPWTRAECARLLAEAGDRVDDSGTVASRIYAALQKEFQSELGPPTGGLDAKLESVYTRVTSISGRPLGRGGESFDIGQTFINDYGRPNEEGTNAVTGFSFYTTAGPWVGYVRGEYQYAPSAPPLPLSERNFIANADGLGGEGIPPATPFATTSQFQLIEAYAGMQLANWLVSFGPQEMWGSPTEGGPMLLSTNSQAIPMIRIAQTSPLKVPLLSKLFGPAWLEFFMGQLSGQYFFRTPTEIIGNYLDPLQNQPYIHGERISWKPTRNFEFGVTRTVIFGGGDIPMTLGYFGRSLLDRGEHNPVKGTANDPGKQASGLDWSYRLPRLRRWVTFYGDAFAWDQLSPIAYWDRSAISAGLYFSHFPKLSKFDFRVEGVYTDVPAGGAIGHGFYYSSGSSPYLQGYTNGGNLIGSWIGRDGQGAQAWTNCWFTPKNRLQLYFRHLKVSQQFLPSGGTLTDFGLHGDLWTSPRWGFSANVQYETWIFPIIQPGQRTVFSSSLQVTYRPKPWGKLSKIN
jgi:membrane-associated phospholipid phosphatase